MYSLTYVSAAVKPLARDALRCMLDQCVENNRRTDITGMLLYKGGNFLQVLEGDEGTVRLVHATIAQDVRHRGLVTLLGETVQQRHFPDWAMGFRDITLVSTTANFSEFLNTPLTADAFSSDPLRAYKLLRTVRCASAAAGAL